MSSVEAEEMKPRIEVDFTDLQNLKAYASECNGEVVTFPTKTRATIEFDDFSDMSFFKTYFIKKI